MSELWKLTSRFSFDLNLQVTPGSKAENAGINEGDLVRSINDSKCEDWTHSDALNSIKKCGFELMMLLCR